ncbi:MAG: two-component sensor histidine kinase, partial [Dolichospermum sp.]
MVKSSQSSFRRILVTRILLVFVPVLLVGELVALNKARSSLLNTARQNLTESAVNKGEKISDDIAALRSNLITASQTKVIDSGSSVGIEEFLKQLKNQLPTQIDCLQLTHIKKGDIIASSCGDQEITPSGLSPTNN